MVSVVAAVGPNEFEPRKTGMYLVEHERGAVAILNAGRVNDDPQRQTFGIDQRVNLAPFDLLAGVIAYAAIITPLFPPTSPIGCR